MAKLFNNYSFIVLIVLGLLSGSACAGDGGEYESILNNEMAVSESFDAEYQQIFNGNDLAGWDGDERFWSIENGAIIGETSSENQTEINTFLIWEDDEPADFEIQFRYRFVIVSDQEYGNSGMQFRSERFENEDFPESD
ncbi:MAG: family 16 glycoside hydrolase, partial [Candidatus Paceibacterota bacterium]